jgi:hypothetical protein
VALSPLYRLMRDVFDPLLLRRCSDAAMDLEILVLRHQVAGAVASGAGLTV